MISTTIHPPRPPSPHHSLAMIVLLSFLVSPALPKSDSQQPKSRQKRILWYAITFNYISYNDNILYYRITEDGRLALPPGTSLVISPSLSLPFIRYPPDGFFSNLTISLPFTSKCIFELPILRSKLNNRFLVDFDKLGLTDNENPYGVLPPLLARSMGRAAGNFLADYIGNILDRRRGKR